MQNYEYTVGVPAVLALWGGRHVVGSEVGSAGWQRVVSKLCAMAAP